MKITFLGAGSTIFARNILGDVMVTDPLKDCHIALYDIDGVRLGESERMLGVLNANVNDNRARITCHCGVENRREALDGADYIVNAIQVGGYRPSTVIDFEISKKYGLRQTIGDSLGIGGIFRGLRTIRVMMDIAADIESVCPNAWLLNYVNPMAIVTGALLRYTNVQTVGLCHSVQSCVPDLLKLLGMEEYIGRVQWEIAGINHMAWLLKLSCDGGDIYPEIRRRGAELNMKARQEGGEKHGDMVRLELMRRFGFYVTESSEHNAEYSSFWIKDKYPELVEEFNIPLDEYPRRCEQQEKEWKQMAGELVNNNRLDHKRTREYGSYIIEAMETGESVCVHGNILNNGFISNLPVDAVVEVRCVVDGNGVSGEYAGCLPVQCAALNMTNVNVQLMTIEAAMSGKRDSVYQAAMLDPHTSGELSIDDIVNMCDELMEAHGDYLGEFK